MHYNLLSVWHEHSDPVVFRVLLQAALSLLDFYFYLLERTQVYLRQNFVLNLFEILFFELYLVWNTYYLLLKLVDLVLVDGNVLSLVPQDWARLSYYLLRLVLVWALCLFSVVYSLLDSLLKVYYLVVNKVLVNFHLLLKISHFALVYKLKYSWTGVFDCLYALFFEVKDLESDLGLERPVWFIVNVLPLQVE